VLRTGVLASRAVRLAALLVVLLVGSAAVAGAVAFLRSLDPGDGEWTLVFEATTVSAVLWCFVAALLTKTLFLNAEGMLSLTTALPVTNRERAAAFVLYEMTMAGVVVAVGVGALTTGALVLRGPAALLPILETIVLPAVLVYLLVNLGHQVLARALTALGIRRAQPGLLVLILFAAALVYLRLIPGLTADLSSAYLDGSSAGPWTSAVLRLAEQWGHAPAIAVTLAGAAALAVLVVLSSPARHLSQARYLPLRGGRLLRRWFGPYEWCAFRSSQTWLPVIIAAATFVALTLNPVVHPLWALSLTSMGALYQFASTEPLRLLRGGVASPWTIYGRLLRAQLLLWAFLAVPVTACVLVVDPGSAGATVAPLLGSLSGSVIALGVGIIFPAVDDNPFSLFLGVSLIGAVLVLVMLTAGLLSLPTLATVAVALTTLVTVVAYSVVGIASSESRRRHEEDRPRRQQPGGSRRADPRDRRGDAAAAHVLDRSRGRPS